jgi:hypothetical protein
MIQWLKIKRGHLSPLKISFRMESVCRIGGSTEIPSGFTWSERSEWVNHPIYPRLKKDEIRKKGLAIMLIDFLAAFAVAFISTVLFALATRKRGLRKGLLLVFLMLLLSTWAGGVWMQPFGPVLWGIHWLTFLLIGAIVALIIAAAQSKSEPHGRQETIAMLERMEQEREAEKAVWATLTVFFWVLVLTLLSVIVIRYVL